MCRLSAAARVPPETSYDLEYGPGSVLGDYVLPRSLHVFPASFVYPLNHESSLLNLGDLLVRENKLARAQVVPALCSVEKEVHKLLSSCKK